MTVDLDSIAIDLRRHWSSGVSDADLFGRVAGACHEIDHRHWGSSEDHRTVRIGALAMGLLDDRGCREPREEFAGQVPAGVLRETLDLCDEAGETVLPYYLLTAHEMDGADADLLARVARQLGQGGHLSLRADLLRSSESLAPRLRRAKELERTLDADQLPLNWRRLRPRKQQIRVLHLVGQALPETRNGYTYRTAHILSAQSRHPQLQPCLVSVLGPRDEAALSSRHEFPFRESAEGGHYVLAPDARTVEMTWPFLVKSGRGLARLAESLGVDVIHAHSDFRPAMIAMLAAAEMHLPVVYESRGLWYETWSSTHPGSETSDRYRKIANVEALCRERVDAVVSLGATLKQHFHDLGLPPERIFLAPNGVESVEPRSPSVERPLKPTLGYVGSVSEYEGLDLLVEAVRLLCQRGVDARCLIVGDGPALDSLKRLAEGSSIADRVELPGRMEPHQARTRLAEIDVLTIPRRRVRVSELVSPLKPLEAMATGVPLLMSDVRALREVSEEGRFASHFTANSATALADAALAILSYWEHTCATAESAKRHAAQMTWARSTEGHVAAYRYAGALR